MITSEYGEWSPLHPMRFLNRRFNDDSVKAATPEEDPFSLEAEDEEAAWASKQNSPIATSKRCKR
jgi:hypothetical protein